MSISKHIDFDLFLSRVKAHDQRQVFKHTAEHSASLCEMSPYELFDICQNRYEECGVSGGEGVAIFDVTSDKIKKPVMLLATFEHEIDFNADDGKYADIFVGVISPISYGAEHLQRLAIAARLFRSQDLCINLRGTVNVDEMKVLFMPTQDWMIAA